jgi:transcriptional regulator with XRE-family HTH domain
MVYISSQVVFLYKENIDRMNQIVKHQIESSESTFGQRLAKAIERGGFESQAEFARQIGVGQAAISRYIHGRRLPDGEVMVRIARVIPDQLIWVLTGLEQEAPKPPLREVPREATREPSADELRAELKRFIDHMPRWLIECLWDYRNVPS